MSVDERHLEELRGALAAVVPALLDELAVSRRRRDRRDAVADRTWPSTARLPTSPTSFRFLLDVTPVDLVERARRFWRDGTHARRSSTALGDDPAVDHGPAGRGRR